MYDRAFVEKIEIRTLCWMSKDFLSFDLEPQLSYCESLSELQYVSVIFDTQRLFVRAVKTLNFNSLAYKMHQYTV